jgi:imidazolonepropionase-like amidohydrolase
VRSATGSGLHGYRADVAFDGERELPGGALVLVAGDLIVGVEPASAPAPADCPVTYVRGGMLLPGVY